MDLVLMRTEYRTGHGHWSAEGGGTLSRSMLRRRTKRVEEVKMKGETDGVYTPTGDRTPPVEIEREARRGLTWCGMVWMM